MELIENESLLAYSSESVLTTVDYILKKFLPTVTVRQILSVILQMITILPCTNLIFLRALHSNLNDLEDAVLYQIALENNIHYFVTHDQEFIKKSSNGPIDIFGAEKLFEVL
ncbi:type II toxin-antitoxin system VapC family toxin [Jiulongibacter sp. NS-SX5]|uniref:type II toxin-antitoxin system VapC family toxin n=1 Tax=Jiulongibacter sp. NS-SX5 TaxID=3463854 RepID=UPI00405A46FD